MYMRIDKPRQDRSAGVVPFLGVRHSGKFGSSADVTQTAPLNQESAVLYWDRPRSIDQPIRPNHERTPTSQSNDIRPRRRGAERHHLRRDLIANEPDPV